MRIVDLTGIGITIQKSCKRVERFAVREVKVDPERPYRQILPVNLAAAQGDRGIVVPDRNIKRPIAHEGIHIQPIPSAGALIERLVAGHCRARREQFRELPVRLGKGDFKGIVAVCAHSQHPAVHLPSENLRGVADAEKVRSKFTHMVFVEQAPQGKHKIVRCDRGALRIAPAGAVGRPRTRFGQGAVPADALPQPEGIDQPIGGDGPLLCNTRLHLARRELPEQPFKYVGHNHAGGRVGHKLRVQAGDRGRNIVFQNAAFCATG